MKVIFLHRVEGVGQKHEVKDISDGYAKNFLLPRGLAKIATPDALRLLEEEKRSEVARESKVRKKMRTIANSVRDTAVIISARANGSGELFGSVTSEQIVSALKNQNIIIPVSSIKLEKPIKHIGEYTTHVDFGWGIGATLKISVVGL